MNDTSRFEFHLWGRDPHFVPSLKIPNLSHYKMMVLNLQRITENDNMITATKWRLVFTIKLLEGDTPPLQNEDWLLYVFIIRLLEGNTSEGQLPLLQNEIGFLHVVFRWANSLATKWISIFSGHSTTETLKTYKMQFPSCGYKMPGPSPFFHLNLSPEMPLKRGTRPPIL